MGSYRYNKNNNKNKNKGGFKGKNNQGSNYRNDDKHTYVGAPYNFVPMAEKVIEYSWKEPPAHNSVDSELISGEISYKITAETPIIIDDGKGNFYKDPYGRYAIPGSSVRGMVRSNAQILSFSSLDQDVDDYRLMYRKVAGKTGDKLKERYNDVLGATTIKIGKKQFSVLKNVRAGYMTCKDGKYYIYNTKNDEQQSKGENKINYYILSERTIAEAYRKYKGNKENKREFSYAFFIRDDNILQHEITLDEGSKNRIPYKGTQNKNYKPYEKECSYDEEDGKITAVGEVDRYTLNGYAVSTGKMNEKKAIYIIPEKGDTHFEVPSADVRAFQIDINKRQNALKGFGGRSHFDLPEEGNERPVFYIHLGERLYFGFTPRLRLYYDNTIKKGMSESQKTNQMDYAKALFGFSIDQDSRKSRVSFSDAVVSGETVTVPMEQPVELILGEPKPTSYWDYLHGGKNYNDADFQLRGIKQYWLRDNTYTNVSSDQKNSDVVSRFKPRKQGTQFHGKVRFHNLKKEEVGLLLWAIRLNDNSQMNIGKAKAFGYGRISLVVNNFMVLNTAEAYQVNTLSLEPMKQGNMDEYVNAYKEAMNEQVGKDIDKAASVATLMAMKDPNRKPNPDTIRFMGLKEYQNRLTPLQNVGEVLCDSELSRIIKEKNVSQPKVKSGQNVKTAEKKRDESVLAEIYKIQTDGTLFLKESNSIQKYSKVPRMNRLGNGNVEKGQKILVRFVKTDKNHQGRISYIYEQVGEIE